MGWLKDGKRGGRQTSGGKCFKLQRFNAYQSIVACPIFLNNTDTNYKTTLQHNNVLLCGIMQCVVTTFNMICDYMWPHVTTCDYMWLHVTTCDYMWLHVTTCDYMWLHVTTCDYMWLHVTTLLLFTWWSRSDCKKILSKKSLYLQNFLELS